VKHIEGCLFAVMTEELRRSLQVRCNACNHAGLRVERRVVWLCSYSAHHEAEAKIRDLEWMRRPTREISVLSAGIVCTNWRIVAPALLCHPKAPPIHGCAALRCAAKATSLQVPGYRSNCGIVLYVAQAQNQHEGGSSQRQHLLEPHFDENFISAMINDPSLPSMSLQAIRVNGSRHDFLP
jgi:hypothetical protein